MNRNDVHKGYISKMSLHDRELLGAIVGLAKTCGNNPYTDDTIKLICDALLAFNEGCDKAQTEEWLERLHKEKYNISPGCAVCQARCGNTDDYDISLILGEEQKKLVALTFDDGPTAGITDKVLDVLKENGVVASFFLIGNNVTDSTAPLVKRAHDMGCSIENHSRTHSAMTTLSEQEILDEISYTSDVIEKLTGDKPPV
jgi:peptidoglycan/xylan/chitin deacetylase (PgdA/CDA1 family)